MEGGEGLTTDHHETLLSVMVCSVLILMYVWRRRRPRQTKVHSHRVSLPEACFYLVLFIFSMIYFVIQSIVSSLFLPVFHHMHGVHYVENNSSFNS
jgi:hypothetical protein